MPVEGDYYYCRSVPPSWHKAIDRYLRIVRGITSERKREQVKSRWIRKKGYRFPPLAV